MIWSMNKLINERNTSNLTGNYHPWWTHPSVTLMVKWCFPKSFGNPRSSSIYRIYRWIFPEINHQTVGDTSIFGLGFSLKSTIQRLSSPVGRRNATYENKPWGPSAHTSGERPEILREQMNNRYVIIYQYTISIRGSNQRCWNVTACIRNENHM